jgi:REP element-mobilizing transposase RayT
MLLHKGAQKRIYYEGATYFVTNHTENWFKFFDEPIFCEVFIANLKLCKIMKKFDLYAFVVILHHFHLLLMPGNPKDLSRIMQFLKRNISRDINFITSNSPEGAIHESLLRVGEETVSRLRERLLLGKTSTSLIKSDHEFNKKLKRKYKKYEKLLEDHYKFLLELKKQFILKYGEN